MSLLLSLFLVAPPPLPDAAAEARAAAVVSKAGGRAVRDLKRPGRPVVDLEGTRLPDRGVARLDGLTDLRRLSLARTRLSDRGTAPLTKMKQLSFLSLARTELTGDGLAALAKLDLRELSLAGAPVGDA